MHHPRFVFVEIIDVATIKPLDIDTILRSIDKTGRAIIIHEAARTCGVGAEIAAQIADKALMSLKSGDRLSLPLTFPWLNKLVKPFTSGILTTT